MNYVTDISKVQGNIVCKSPNYELLEAAEFNS
jgi:hypothetical protein